MNMPFETFNIHAPPDVTADTHIIAALGIAQQEAAPDCDGWMFSDFLAFWGILWGLTENQTWSHCLDLEALLDRH